MQPGKQPDPAHHGDRLGQDDVQVRAAVRLAVRVVIGALAFIALAAIWVQNCDGAVETAACGLPYRTVLALGAPLILAGGGLWAFWRTYLVWRDCGTWWGWQGAGWVLLSLMVFAVIVIAPPIVGPALNR